MRVGVASLGMTDFATGETSRRETIGWLVRFIGYLMFAWLGVGLVAGVIVAFMGAPAGAVVGVANLAGLLAVAFMCVSTSGPMPSALDFTDEEEEESVAR